MAAKKTPKVKSLPKSAGSKAKDVKGGLMATGTSDKTYCCRTACGHAHCG